MTKVKRKREKNRHVVVFQVLVRYWLIFFRCYILHFLRIDFLQFQRLHYELVWAIS